MEPQNDPELRDLLREWTPPETPRSLEHRVLKSREPWWRLLIFGYLRVPVPVACVLAAAMIAGGWRLTHAPAAGCSAETRSTPAWNAAPADTKNAERRSACASDSSC